MDNNKFVKLLKESNLNKKQFSEKTKLAYSTVGNWATSNNVPDWVESWLENYNKVKAYDDIKEKILEIENIKIKTS